MSTLLAAAPQSNPRPNSWEVAEKRFHTKRQAILWCMICRKTTRGTNVQAWKFCPHCGTTVRVRQPGKPHRPPRSPFEVQP